MQTQRPADDEVIDRARWIWENGRLQRTGHFEVELKNAGATMVDAEDVLFGACVIRKAEWNMEHRQWRYTILGYDCDGCEPHLVVSIDINNSELVLITAF
jgi:hypothetical protein